jgi:hypothetical protein
VSDAYHSTGVRRWSRLSNGTGVFKRPAARAIVTAARASVTADSNVARPLCALPTPQRMSVVGSRDRASASAGSTACARFVAAAIPGSAS